MSHQLTLAGQISCMDITDLINLENECICAQLLAECPVWGDDAAVNNWLDSSGCAALVHREILMRLVATYLNNLWGEDAARLLKKYFVDPQESSFQCIEGQIEIAEIPTLAEQLHNHFLNATFQYKRGALQRIKSKKNLIELGAVYTRPNIAREIVETAMANYLDGSIDANSLKILDFACGTGRFSEQIVEVLFQRYNIKRADAVRNNLYAIDIDPNAININRLKAIALIDNPTEKDLEVVARHMVWKNGLMFEEGLFGDEFALNYSDMDGLVAEGFDIIVSNPPYLVLKMNKDKGDAQAVERIKQQVSYFRNSSRYRYSIEGMLNLYQISLESMLGMLKRGGEMGIICPSTLFADKSATTLRKHLLLAHKVRAIRFFSEKASLFDNVTQATNIFFLQKKGETDTISIERDNECVDVPLDVIKQLFPLQLEIPFLSQTEFEILRKLRIQRKLKEYAEIRNRRGELDLTLFKDYITTERTPHRLIRGCMIEKSGINHSPQEYVHDSFLSTKKEEFLRMDFKRPRLVCQQISNVDLAQRLNFVFCTDSDILANSCNYISADWQILRKLHLLLNSSLLNWRFKLTSTNNHINNYELDELPIVNLEKVNADLQFQNQSELDHYVCALYGLTETETNIIISK